MASTSSYSTKKKICRKCKGSCPPCRPWRCKFIKGRTLKECENDLEKSLGSLVPMKPKRFSSAPTTVHANRLKKESLNNMRKALAALSLRNDSSALGVAVASDESFSDKSSGGQPGFAQTSTSNDETSSSAASCNATSTGTNSALISRFDQRRMLPFPAHLMEPERSHIFLAIAADPLLVQYSKMVLNNVTVMPEIPEIASLADSRCIWPHTVHLTIYSFGKVFNGDIPRIADYCKENIKVMEPFHLNITGMFHHQKLHTVGFKVDKRTVEPLRQIWMNMTTWFNKGMSWNGYTPVLSLLRTQTPRGAKFSCAPFSSQSIETILQKFGGVEYMQEVIPARDIQLCLARSSTETTFYKNLLL